MDNMEEIIQSLYKDSIFLYVMGGLCALGVILKFFLLLAYNRLIRASESITVAKNPWMKNMKLRFETAYQLKIGVNDVDTYVDKYVSKSKFGGLLLSTWENLSGQTIALCLLIGSCAGILGLVYKCEQGSVLFTFFTGAWTAIVVNIVDNIVNISAHKQMLRFNLIDYFENYLKVRMEQEVYHPEILEAHQKEYFKNEGVTDNLNNNRAAIESACFSRWESKRLQRMERRRKRQIELAKKDDENRLLEIERQAQKDKIKKEKLETKLAQKHKKQDEKNYKQQLREAKSLAVTIEHQVNKEKQIEKKEQNKEKEKAKEEKKMKQQNKLDEKFRMEQKRKQEKLKKEEEKKKAVMRAKEDKEKLKKEKEVQKLALEQKKLKEKLKSEEEKKQKDLENNKAYIEKTRLIQEKERDAARRAQEAKLIAEEKARIEQRLQEEKQKAKEKEKEKERLIEEGKNAIEKNEKSDALVEEVLREFLM